MRLYRRGTERNHGFDTILADHDEEFKWRNVPKRGVKKKRPARMEREKHLYTVRHKVPDGKKGSHHNYTLELSLSDFASMLDQVVDNAFRDSREELAKLMAPRIGKIHLLMMCANGYPPPEELYEEVDDEDKYL